MNDIIAPYMGPSIIDVSKVRPKLVDLTNGTLTGAQREKPGFLGVFDELSKAIPQYGETLGMHPGIWLNIVDKTATLDEIRALKKDVLKLAEVLEESELYYEDAREADISRIGQFVDATARHGDPSVQAAFNKTLEYRSQYAKKAADKRRKNKQARAETDAARPTEAKDPNPT
ncbi:hypothetical protein [Polyangium mundeleinium]|uniref:Uncharacterized protein n=1 Tax=Polyangium mundeleinium TaxID=2995306 RepID=A0ABT5F438_9BACT|nr:hypothetical protein [Polyangium mundeleinium]MDC0748389.1 hypothetical protein [Polyangium mundeleinium]